jgi:hypothetical protein
LELHFASFFRRAQKARSRLAIEADQIGACAGLACPYTQPRIWNWFGPPHTIRLPASACNERIPAICAVLGNIAAMQSRFLVF